MSTNFSGFFLVHSSDKSRVPSTLNVTWHVFHILPCLSFACPSSRGVNTASMPTDRIQAKQGMGNISLPNWFRHLYETLRQENLGRHCREWPACKTDSEIRQLIQENSKPQDLIVYTECSVTKDQPGWSFIVKQGATTIHEDYEV